MKTSDHGIDFIAACEGFEAKAYHLEGEEFWTIGYGHNGPDVHQGEVIDHARGLALLAKDVQTAEGAVNALIPHLRFKLNQNQFDALVSIVFNCGAAILEAGRTLGNALRRHRGVPAAMMVYVKDSAGRTLTGLVARRRAEGDLWAAKVTPAMNWLTGWELKRVRELDTLRKLTKTSAKERARIAELRRELTAQRKRIWHSAQPKAKGGDGRGWTYRARRQRYNSLLARTR